MRVPGLLFALPLLLAAQPATLEEWLAAIGRADRAVLSKSVAPPPGLAAALASRLPALKGQPRVVAAQALARVESAEAASVLLTLVDDPDLNVAASATRGLRDAAALPPGTSILARLLKVQDPTLRSHLYLAAGRARTPLEDLRRAIASESNPEARDAAVAAAVRLGGAPERDRLAASLRSAKADQLVRLLDLVKYTADKRLAPALLPLLDSSEPVVALSPRPNSPMARRADLAVWTAHQLGLIPHLKLTALRRFDPATVAKTRAACARKE
jgi:hypothetical protein